MAINYLLYPLLCYFFQPYNIFSVFLTHNNINPKRCQRMTANEFRNFICENYYKQIRLLKETSYSRNERKIKDLFSFFN